MKKEDLINEIREAFKNVKLEDGIGLWEAQGIDDYADCETMAELSKKDERQDWDKIPYKDLSACDSSLCFFDAKGMLFHLPKFLIFDILHEEIYKSEGLSSPDLVISLELKKEYKDYLTEQEYQKERFSSEEVRQILGDNIPFLNMILSEERHLRLQESQAERFSLLNKQQILCVIHFLEYKMEIDPSYIQEINNTLNSWKEKLQ